MKRTTCTELLIRTISEKGITYQQLADKIGRSLIWTTHALHGKAAMERIDADKIAALLELGYEVSSALQEVPSKGSSMLTLPSDPAIYRFYELMQVYGTTLKTVINEKFGDGVMSAIDFNMEIEKVENPTGDRLRITMDGKFLAFNGPLLKKSKGLITTIAIANKNTSR